MSSRKHDRVNRPTENIALARWEKQGCPIRSNLFDDITSRQRALWKGQLAIAFPEEYVIDSIWWDTVCTYRKGYVLQTAPKEYVAQLLSVLPNNSYKLWVL